MKEESKSREIQRKPRNVRFDLPYKRGAMIDICYLDGSSETVQLTGSTPYTLRVLSEGVEKHIFKHSIKWTHLTKSSESQ